MIECQVITLCFEMTAKNGMQASNSELFEWTEKPIYNKGYNSILIFSYAKKVT